MLKRFMLIAGAAAAAACLASFAAIKVSAAEEVRLPVVMYHHISEKSKLWGDYVISPDQFESDLIYLKDRGYTPVTVSELIAWCEGSGELPEKPVMITFDDGYESTYVYAAPLLEKHDMTGVVAVIGAVAQQYTDNEDHNIDYSHMNWQQVCDLCRGDVFEVQCHTWDMHHLSPRKGCGKLSGESSAAYAASLSEDISTFNIKFESYTDCDATALALPYGFYSAETIEIAKQLGFKAVFTCTEKVNQLTGSADELMEICRYNRPHGMDSASFFSQWESYIISQAAR